VLGLSFGLPWRAANVYAWADQMNRTHSAQPGTFAVQSLISAVFICVRDRLRYKQYTLRTEQAYIVRFAFDSCSIFLGVLGVLAV
jgi:hypothetical protein